MADFKTQRKQQSAFCLELMKKLNRNIENVGHTVIQDDIKRLRRELLELSKMHDWTYKYKGEL